MTQAGYVAVGYVTVFGSIAGYAWWMLRRGRRLSREVVAEDRRWL
jgi:hypothetical protein